MEQKPSQYGTYLLALVRKAVGGFSIDSNHSSVASSPAASPLQTATNPDLGEDLPPLNIFHAASMHETTGGTVRVSIGNTRRQSTSNIERESTINRTFWMKDGLSKECYDCHLPFSLVRRRHHCRICNLDSQPGGQIFCYRCASAIVSGLRFGHGSNIRVCNFCMGIMDDYSPNTDIAAFTTNDLSRKRSTSLSSPNNLFSIMLPEIVDTSKIRKLIGNTFFESNSPSRKHKSNLPFRKIAQSRSDSDDIVVGQYMVEDELGALMVNEDCLPSPYMESGRNSLLAMDHDCTNRKPSESRLRAKIIPLHISGRWATSLPEFEYNNSSISRNGRTSQSVLKMDISSAPVKHLRNLMKQVLDQSRIPKVDEWEETIIEMVLKACSVLSPDVRSGDEIDIRHYVKIKRIPGGR